MRKPGSAANDPNGLSVNGPPAFPMKPFAGIFLRQFLSQAFKRPVTEGQLETYLDVVRQHLRQFPEARVEGRPAPRGAPGIGFTTFSLSLHYSRDPR